MDFSPHVPSNLHSVSTHPRSNATRTTTLNLDPSTPRRILLPVSRVPQEAKGVSSGAIEQLVSAFNNAPDPKSKQASGKLTRAARSPTMSLSAMDLQSSLMASSSMSMSGHKAKQDSISPSSSIRKGLFQSENDAQPAWIQERLGNFELVDDSAPVSGFQLYAVEKWVVERRRLLTTIAVFTGDDNDKIHVTVLRPLSTLPEDEAVNEFNAAIQKLRKDGARPKETELGVIMTTFLPNFRPDLAIVQIPSGNFRLVQQRLYANIDLLRMGCTGRSALTLDEPYDSTKEKFIQIYHFPEYLAQLPSSIKVSPHHTHTPASSIHGTSSFLTKSGHSAKGSSKEASRGSHLEQPPAFQVTVLNLVRLVQSALSLFGHFDVSEDERDGLLCDLTVEGIRKCIEDISRLVDVEPTERVLDPSALAAIFSTIISVRNKLQALGIAHVKDPFMEPRAFMQAVIAFQRSNIKHRHSESLATPIQGSLSPTTSRTISPYLSYELIRRIDVVYAAKVRSPEPYKVHRVIKHKIDDSLAKASTLSESLASGTAAALGISNSGVTNMYDGEHAAPGYHHAPPLGSLESPVTDLETLVRMVVGSGSKEGSGSIDTLKYVWTGKANAGSYEWARRDKAKGILDEQEKTHRQRQKERDREREREVTVTPQNYGRGGAGSASAARDGGERMKSDGEDGGLGRLWTGKAGRLFGNSLVELGLGRGRKNTDLQSDPEQGPMSANQSPVAKRTDLPSLMITQPSGVDLQSGFLSPTRDMISQPSSGMPSPTLGPSVPPSSSQVLELSPRHSRPLDSALSRPVSFGAFREDDRHQWDDSAAWRRRRRRLNLTEHYNPSDDDPLDPDDDDDFDEEDEYYIGDGSASDMYEMDWWVRKPPKKRRPGDSDRRHSINQCSEYRGYQLMKVDHMKADVDLCGAYMELMDKSEDMDRIARLLEALLESTEISNDKLSTHLDVLKSAYETAGAYRQKVALAMPQILSTEEQVKKVGAILAYRTTVLGGNTSRLQDTLHGYDKRTKRAMVQAAAEGALDHLQQLEQQQQQQDEEDAEKAKELDLEGETGETSELRHRRLRHIDPE